MKNLTPTLTRSNDRGEILTISKKLGIEPAIAQLMKQRKKGVAKHGNYLFTFSCSGETLVYHSAYPRELALAAFMDGLAEALMAEKIRQAA